MFPWNNLTDTDLKGLCQSNSTVNEMDPNCSCLLIGGGPEINTDVSGPGVRISFYLQALFLALLAARSDSINEISNALYTLIVTNVSMATTSLILGFKPQPDLSLHDAIVVFYLLAGSWLSIFFSLPSYNRFVKSDSTLQTLTIVHSYVIFAFVLAVLATAGTFGKTPRCNSHAVGVIFYHFQALNGGRIAALVFVCLIILIYSCISVSDYYLPVVEWYRDFRWKRWKGRWKETYKGSMQTTQQSVATGALVIHPRQLPDIERGVVDPEPSHRSFLSEIDPQSRAQTTLGASGRKRRKGKAKYYPGPGATASKSKGQGESHYVTGVVGYLVVEILVIVVLWALFVMNTELLIRWNRFDGGGDGLGSDLWGFGQILPLFLVLLPFVQVLKAFQRLGLRKRPHRTRKHRRGLSTAESAARRAHRDSGTHSHHSHEPPPFYMGWFPFSQTARDTDTTAYPSGNQPSAHISEVSLHSAESGPELKMDDVAESSESSVSTSSSASRLSRCSRDSPENGGAIMREKDEASVATRDAGEPSSAF